MQRTFLDFETFWSDEFTLKKMTPIEYVLDPRFEALGCGFIHEGGSRDWVEGPDLPKYMAKYDWKNTFAIAHNATFDMLILSMRYGIVPGFYGDTLSMSRNWLSHILPSSSLASVAEYYGMPAKWGTVNKTKGINFHALTQMPALRAEVGGYGLDDTIKCREIFGRIMSEGFPPQELGVIDMVVRMVTCPAFQIDSNVLSEHLIEVQAAKAALLDNAGLTKDTLSSVMSDQQLAVKLLFLGVDPPMKTSKTTGKEAYAFAKSDKAFTELLEHENPLVQALVAARIGHKSTLEETRTIRLMSIGAASPNLPVPLKYSGAHTHRFSGDWKINLQNLGRSSKLRRALRAPKGKVVVSVDASQIEARFNATLAGETKLVSAFRGDPTAEGMEGVKDVYGWFAQFVYPQLGPITKATHPLERFIGKTAVLSLGYGSGAPVFQNMCRVQGNAHLTDSEATSVVMIYRMMFKEIVKNWYYANNTILPFLQGMTHVDTLANDIIGKSGDRNTLQWGPLRVQRNSILLPNGNRLRYRDLRQEYVSDPAMGTSRMQWTFFRGAMRSKIYGAKVVENVIQALAFVHVMEVAMRVKKLTDGLLMPAHQVHDELIYIVDERHAELTRDVVIQEMARSPEWMPDAPLGAEGGIGYSYGETK